MSKWVWLVQKTPMTTPDAIKEWSSVWRRRLKAVFVLQEYNAEGLKVDSIVSNGMRMVRVKPKKDVSPDPKKWAEITNEFLLMVADDVFLRLGKLPEQWEDFLLVVEEVGVK